MSLTHTQKLLEIMAQLRDPERGCPWDLRQDFASLAPYTLEEAYEVVDAIERGDFDDLRKELGDLLLQVVFHAQLANEQGLFDFEHVALAISEKLIERHPHVFAGVEFANDEARQAAWEAAKAQERLAKSASSTTPQSVLDGIANSLPALVQCEKTQDRAAQYGFDWPAAEPVFDKVKEELHEVHEAWQSGDQRHVEEEIGDLLLVVVNLARHLKVNPEMALKQATRKFARRFYFIETQVAESQRELSECSLAELDRLWDLAKQAERAS